jgi:Carboxypeptidase regulatory-like domain
MRFLWISLTLFLCLGCVLPDTAGERYSISGTVSDPSGAGIAGASVAVHQRGGPVVGTVRTGSTGAFRLTGLPVGDFDVDAVSDGFAAERIPVTIEARSPAPLRITLKLAGIRQEITVSEAAARVSTDSSDNLDVVTLDRDMLDNLPIFDQNYVAAMSNGGALAVGVGLVRAVLG